MDDKFRSRKWQLAVFTAVAATVFLAFDKLTGAEWAGVMGTLTLAYNVANAFGRNS